MTDILEDLKRDHPSTQTADIFVPLLAEHEIHSPPGQKLRILLVITRLTIGGDTNVVLDLASALNNHPDFEAHLAVGPVPDHEIDLTHLAYQRDIPTRMIAGLVNYIDPRLNLRALWELRSLIVKEKYDLVHTHSSVAGVVGRLAALLAGRPVIVHHIHGWGIQEDMSTLMRLVYVNLERLCASFTTRLIAVSKATIEKGLANRIASQDKYSLIYNGIDLEDFRQPVEKRDVALELGLDADCKVVGLIGRLDRQKNPLDFIRAAAIVAQAYPRVQFLIAGEGSLRAECEALIDASGLRGRFFLLGFRNDIARILPMLTVLVSSSLWEGLPVVFQEAMSAGKPIVATDVDGARDVIEHGVTGYLVTPHRPEEMAAHILELLENEALCSEMGAVGRQRSEYFSKEQMVENIEALYTELLQAHPDQLAVQAADRPVNATGSV